MAAQPPQDLHVDGYVVEHSRTRDNSPGSGSVTDTTAAEKTPDIPSHGTPAPKQKRPVRLVKDKGRGPFRLPADSRLQNNLFHIVGALELANAGDFAANIWNTTPVPVHAVVLMAIGGTVAAVMVVYAFADAWLAWNNVRFLRRQRRDLEEERARRLEASQSTEDIDVLLAVSFREYGGEAINRWGMDVLMGGGAVLISIGTYMAIGGANDKVWLASNLLSGYIGNTPIAVYGVVNCMWAAYVWTKLQGHVRATAKVMSGTRQLALIKRRCRNVQVYCVINGTATIVGGVASMITATHWQAYIPLIPVILSSFFCNFWFRKRVGYTRQCVSGIPNMTVESLSAKLEYAARVELRSGKKRIVPLSQLMTNPTCLHTVLAFLEEHGMLEDFFVRILADAQLGRLLANETDTEVNLLPSDIVALPESAHPGLVKLAEDTVEDAGQDHFIHEERFAAELLGTLLHHRQRSTLPSEVAQDGTARKA